MTFGSFCTVNCSLNTWHTWYHIIFVLIQPSLPHYFVNRIPLKLSFFVCLPNTQVGAPRAPIRQTDTSLGQIDSPDYNCLFMHQWLAVSVLQYWLPTSSTNCCSIYNPNKSQSRFSFSYPIRGCQYPTNNC